MLISTAVTTHMRGLSDPAHGRMFCSLLHLPIDFHRFVSFRSKRGVGPWSWRLLFPFSRFLFQLSATMLFRAPASDLAKNAFPLPPSDTFLLYPPFLPLAVAPRGFPALHHHHRLVQTAAPTLLLILTFFPLLAPIRIGSFVGLLFFPYFSPLLRFFAPST